MLFSQLFEMVADLRSRCHPDDTVEIDVPVLGYDHEADYYPGVRRLAVQRVERHGRVVIVFGSGRPLTPRGG